MAFDEWRIAYAKQGHADLDAREQLLLSHDLPDCQQLHFLQMASEKICKAYRCGKNTDPKTLSSSHAHIAITLPKIAREQLAFTSRQKMRDQTWMVEAIRVLARKIELLAPSVDDGGRKPANCEYPWEGPNGTVLVPCEHNFELNLLHEKAGRHLIKVLYEAAKELMEPGGADEC